MLKRIVIKRVGGWDPERHAAIRKAERAVIRAAMRRCARVHVNCLPSFCLAGDVQMCALGKAVRALRAAKRRRKAK